MADRPTEETGKAETEAKPKGIVSLLRKPFALVAAYRWPAIGAAVLLVVTIGVVAGMLLWTPPPKPQPVSVELALALLDRGQYQLARTMAEKLYAGRLSPEAPLGTVPFILGAAAAGQARSAAADQRKSLYLVAARYLEEAKQLGFPEQRRQEGLFLLGSSLYEAGQMAACRPVLLEALKMSPPRAMEREIHRLLAEAYLNGPMPDPEKARKHNRQYLAGKTLTKEQRVEGLLREGRILLRAGKPDECLNVLAQIPEKSPRYGEALILRAEALIEQARRLRGADRPQPDTVRQKVRSAMKLLRLAQTYRSLAVRPEGRAMYLLGVCMLQLQDARAALAQFERVAQLYPGSHEGRAARFQQAEILRKQGHYEKAFSAYVAALSGIDDPTSWRNPWLPIEQLRKRLAEVRNSLIGQRQYDMCLRLVSRVHAIVGSERALQWQAETLRQWGEELLADARQLSPAEAARVQRKGRARLRRAGAAYARLARRRVATRYYPDDLRQSAECFLRGHGYEAAVRVLQHYLKDITPTRRPWGLVALGSAFLSLGKVDEALASFEECIRDFPTDPAVFRAKVLAGYAYLEKGKSDKAKQMWKENLSGQLLAPSSREWRDSLFALGRLLYLEGNYEDATARLREAVSRYPQVPEALEARYLLAYIDFRHAVDLLELPQANVLESTLRRRRAEAQVFLQSALRAGTEVQQALGEKQQSATLSLHEQAILRNTDYLVAAALFRLGRYKEAAEAYHAIVNTRGNRAESLDAYVELVRTYRALGQLDKSRQVLHEAKLVLGRMTQASPPPDQSASLYSLQQWGEVLSWLEGL